VLRLRWVLALSVVAISLFSVMAIPTLRVDSSNEHFFIEGDPYLALTKRFESLFRNDDFVYVLVEAEDFFETDLIERFWGLADDLERNVPYVADATWLGNAEFVEGREDAIEIYDLLDTVPRTPAELERFRDLAYREPLFLNSLISTNGRVAGLLLEMSAYPDDHVDPRKEIAPAVEAILAKPEYDGLALHVIGGPIMDYQLDAITAEQAATMMGLCVLVQLAVLFWVGRGTRGIVVPITVVNLAVLWTFGMIGVYGFVLNLFVIVVPLVLLCVGIGDSMHLIAEFHDHHDAGAGRHEAIVEALSRVGLPCLLTSLTTAAGFLSFLSAHIKPFREMGIYSATGCILALLLTYVLVPLFYSWGREPVRATERRSPARAGDRFDHMLARIHVAVVERPRTIIAVFCLLTLAGLLGVPRVQVESNTVRLFTERVPLRQAYDWVDLHMGGSMSIEIMIDTHEESGVTDPRFLAKLESFERFVKTQPLTNTTVSVLDILRQTRRAFHENREEFYSIPETREEAAQYLLIYEMSGGSNKEKLVTYGYDVARLTVRTRAVDSRDIGLFVDTAGEKAREIFGDAADVAFTGMMPWVKVMNDRVAEGQRASFLTAAIVIGLIMMAVLRSVPLGLISMVPNVFPVIMVLAAMGYGGVYMDMGMMSISAIIIGVAVDDTIHFFVRFRREFEIHGRYGDAIGATLASVGRPIVFTTLTLSLGFSVLVFASVLGMIKFGIFAAYAFVWALLADLLFAPALLYVLKPLGPERTGPTD
jgi:hydrophobe/amphiphile efflux-3 (HAE3) family protein